MADLTNIARPYALAAFDIARDKNQLSDWKAFLATAVSVAQTPTVVRVASNPEAQVNDMYELFRSVLQSTLNTERENFLHLLAVNRRLLALPEIADAFSAYCEQLEKISKVRVVTAITATAEFLNKLKAALTKRIKRDVTIDSEVDPSILGGAIIHMGDDSVIDGSIRGQLTRLLEYSLR